MPLKALSILREVASTQLYATVPKRYTQAFREKLYFINLSRFATMSSVLLVLDTLSLGVYGVYYLTAGGLRPAHLAVHLVKLALMGLMLYLTAHWSHTHHYRPRNFFVRNFSIFYACLHIAGEFLLFATGPQDLGAFIRLLAGPFIIGAVPIISQARIVPLEVGMYLLDTGYVLFFTGYAFNLIPSALVLNVLLVACVCSVLVSNVIYSATVNNFMQGVREQQSQDELKRLNAQLDIIARRDQLTGLSNRRDFDTFMDLTWGPAAASRTMVTFVIFDIDHFKLFNDRFGHVAGDECLVRISKAVQETLTNSESIIARYGGEEFVVVAYGAAHATMVEMAEKMRKSVLDLRIENPDSGVSPYLSISLGVATFCAGDIREHRNLIQIADECLYFAKRAGRNRVVHLDGETRQFLDIDGNQMRHEQTGAGSEAPRRSSDQLDQAIREVNLNCTFLYSAQHRRLEFSPYAQELLEMPGIIADPTPEKIIDMLPVPEEERDACLRYLAQALQGDDRNISFEICLLHQQEKHWVAVRAIAIRDEDGRLSAVSGSLFLTRNILAYSSYTYEQAMINTISLLPSRNRFYSDLDTLLASGTATGFLILFDIANFKSINSIFSHSIGDKTLRKVGSLLVKMTEGEAKVYHYTTDQFILHTRNNSQAYVRALVERIQRFFNTYDVTIEGIPIRVGFYAGAVMVGEPGEHLNDLMVDLDIALQKAKLERSKGFNLFQSDDKADYLAQVGLEKELVKAVDDGFAGFSLYYQPLFSSRSQRCVGAEALLRYKGPGGDLISPVSVIPLLERAGLIDRTGQWVLQEACRQCRQWVDSGADPDFFVHVNLSASQLEHTGFAEDIFDTLLDTGLEAGNLVLEVTESVFLSEATSVISGLHALRNAGVRIAIDDFGTGYSSFSYLRTLPADEIKIDKSFVDDADKDEAARRILMSIVMLLKGMGFLVCVEGVETEAQMRVLRDSSADLLQGFLFGKPEAPRSFERNWLSPSQY